MKCDLASNSASRAASAPSRKRLASPPPPPPPPSDRRFAAARWDPRFSRVPKSARRQVTDERFAAHLRSNRAFRDLHTPLDRFGRPKRDAVHADHLHQPSDDERRPAPHHLDQPAQPQLQHIPLGRATPRLAVLGLDWSCTRAVDVLASLSCFCAPGSRIVSVEVHPSKFGLARLQQEATLGPQVLSALDMKVVHDAARQRVNNADGGSDEHREDEPQQDEHEDDEEEEQNDEEDKQWREQLALRKYEEERLKYYYAVVQFDDAKSADAVYKQCDGVEYAQTGLEFDLRFIPNEMSIDTTPRERADAIPDGYQPARVEASSLNTSRVKLSWDADDARRVVLRRGALGRREQDEQNLRAYLAGGESDDSQQMSDAEVERKKRALLGGVEELELEQEQEQDDMNMEISFEPGMFEKGEHIVKRKEQREQRDGESGWERRLRRERERKAARREKRRALREARDKGEDDDEHGEQGDKERADDAGFDDAFFAKERSVEQAEAEAEERHDGKTKTKRRGAREHNGADELNAAQALVVGEHGRRSGNNKKRSRGRRRWQRGDAAQAEAESSSGGGGGGAADAEATDRRFDKVLSSHLFAMDPTHSKFRRNATTTRILAEKRKRRAQRDDDHAA